VAKEVSTTNNAKSAEYINNSPPYFVYPSTTMHLSASKGQGGCAATVGACRRMPLGTNKYWRSEGESIKKFPDK
jgi:hypothetical protein